MCSSALACRAAEGAPAGGIGRVLSPIARALILALACASLLTGSLWGAEGEGKAADTSAPKSASRAKKAADPWDPVQAAEDFRRLQFELALAKTGEVYMILDADRREILLKLKGAVVWNSRMEVAPEDSEAVGAFVRRFTDDGQQIIRMLTSKHLFAAKEKTPDSVLAIVAEVVKADPQLLQRDIPERFELKWGWDLILDVRTDIAGEPRSRFGNLRVSAIEALRSPFGGTRLRVKLASDDALTLYRAASRGLPTLVYSSL
jgi:hypothetical protein